MKQPTMLSLARTSHCLGRKATRLASHHGHDPSRSPGRMAQTKTAIPIRLVIADAHEIERLGTRSVLDQISHITIVGEAGTIAAARQILDRKKIDLALIELRFPDGNGIEFCRQIRASFPNVQVVFFTESIDTALTVSALEVGAVGVLDKTITGENLARVLETVRNGYAIIDRGMLQKSITHLRRLSMTTNRIVDTDLSAQEQQMMELITQGKTNKEITVILGLTQATVKSRIHHIYKKLQVTCRAHATSTFLERIRAKNRISIAGLGRSLPA